MWLLLQEFECLQRASDPAFRPPDRVPQSRLLGERIDRPRAAQARDVGVTLDAEESERLELTLDLFDALSREFRIGLAVQAYQKRALGVCEWLSSLRRSS